MNISTGVFGREHDQDTLTGGQFYATLSLSLLWGLVATAVVGYKAVEMQYMPGIVAILVLGLALPIIGILVAINSNNPVLSFIGYNMLVVPFGIIMGPVVNLYRPDVVHHALAMTAGITCVMGIAGTCFPNVFKNLGAPLFIALCGLVVVRIIQIFVPGLQSLTWVDYVAAGIFSLYIGYDMYRASSVAKTIDNAVDVSMELYLDIINLFLTLLRIFGRSGNN